MANGNLSGRRGLSLRATPDRRNLFVTLAAVLGSGKGAFVALGSFDVVEEGVDKDPRQQEQRRRVSYYKDLSSGGGNREEEEEEEEKGVYDGEESSYAKEEKKAAEFEGDGGGDEGPDQVRRSSFARPPARPQAHARTLIQLNFGENSP